MTAERDFFDPIHLVEEATKGGKLVLVTSVQKEDRVVDRNTGRDKPHIHGVHLFLAFRQPHYELTGMEPAFEDFWYRLQPTLPPDIIPNLAFAATLYPDSGDKKYVHFSGFKAEDLLAERKQEIMSTFVPRNDHARTVLEQSGLNQAVYQTKREDLILRTVEGVIYPSIAFAELAAVCMRMEHLDNPLVSKRPYPFKNWPYYVRNVRRGTLTKDLEKLATNESYLQKMANRCLVGYKVSTNGSS